MKRILTFLAVIAVVQFSNAQQGEEKAIEASILNYIENFFENDYQAMLPSLHPRLAKRGLNPGGGMSEDFPPAKLKELMSQKKAFAKADQKNVVSNISVFGDMASAELETGYPKMRWKEYIHMVKVDGQWQLINVFWDYYPRKPKGKK